MELRAWYHVTFSTFGAWLRGDERGFRDHDHRVHSSGDYTNPPPKREHEGLRRWTLAHLHKDPVTLTPAQRESVGRAIVAKLAAQRVEVLILAVSGQHVHLLAGLSMDRKEQQIGNAKRASSHALRSEIPGAVWGRRADVIVTIGDPADVRAFRYIEAHGAEGAWVWTFRDKTGPQC
jgi:REP element-mobilizing transposase RayT